MKKYVFFSLIIFFAVASCRSNKATSSSAAGSSSLTAAPAGSTTGKVSHQYRSTGCATVIVFTKDGTEMTLIPKDKLAAELDADGLEITFNYHLLKMPNPAGCSVGMPAEITDAAKK
jgi:hypothetical protein